MLSIQIDTISLRLVQQHQFVLFCRPCKTLSSLLDNVIIDCNKMQIENCTVDEDAEGGNDWFYYKLCNVKTKLPSLRK